MVPSTYHCALLSGIQTNLLVFIMKLLAVALSLVVAVSCAPQYNPNVQYPQYTSPIPIISQSQEGPNPDGSYKYSYETGNGISAGENGYVKNLGNPQLEAQVAEGYYSYTAPDGTPVQIRYISDEGGFRPEGNVIPTSPPIPPAIQKALAFIASQPQQPQQYQAQQPQQYQAQQPQYFNGK